MKATSINVHVATQERVEKRDMPHTPWPLVHPLANVVPAPTKSPATTISQGGNCNSPSNKDGANTLTATPANNSPKIKYNCQRESEFALANTDLTMPDIPAIFPYKTSSNVHAIPINAPPIAADTGVNSVIIFKFPKQ